MTSDDEGNNGGAIHTNIKKLEIIPIYYDFAEKFIKKH